MSRHIHISVLVWVAAFCVFALLGPIAVSPVFAQAEDDPFGGAGPVLPMVDPGDKMPPPGPGAEPARREADSPIVLSVRESNPTTPEQLIRATEIMLNIKRYDEAKRYLKQLLDAKPDMVALATMHRAIGSGFFIRLLNEPEAEPEARQVANLVLTAADRYARDPGRMQAMVQKLLIGDALVREQAYEGFRDAGVVATVPLIAALGQLQSPEGYDKLREGLVRVGQAAVEPLIGALASPKEAQRAQAMIALGQLGARRALPYLIAPYLAKETPRSVRSAAEAALRNLISAMPAREEGELYLRREVDSFYRGKLPLASDVDGNVTVWRYDAATGSVVPLKLSAADAALAVAAQLSADLHSLNPTQPDYLRMYLMATLEAAKVTGGLDRALDRGPGSPLANAVAAGPAALDAALEEALARNRIPAAVGLCEALGEAGDVGVLYSTGTTPQPLARALENGDRRVRFAAAAAIMKLDPTKPFAGCSALPEVLGYLASSVGTRRALVCHPQPEEAQSLVGMLSDMGYRAEATYTGRAFMIGAVSSPDIELLLVSDAIDKPRASELVQHLRHDPRTARLPIGIFCREENLRAMQRVAELDPLTAAFPKPPDEKAMVFHVRGLLSRTGRHQATYPERVVQASAALDYLTLLAADRKKYSFYDVARQEPAVQRALDMPELSPQACRVLGLMATPSAQRALVTLAGQSARPLADRQAAAKAFAIAVERSRVLLTKSEIALQYERYNQSRTADEATQQVLASLLDAMEATIPAEEEQAM